MQWYFVVPCVPLGPIGIYRKQKYWCLNNVFLCFQRFESQQAWVNWWSDFLKPDKTADSPTQTQQHHTTQRWLLLRSGTPSRTVSTCHFLPPFIHSKHFNFWSSKPTLNSFFWCVAFNLDGAWISRAHYVSWCVWCVQCSNWQQVSVGFV